MKAAEPATEKDSKWSKTQSSNLIRYVPSGKYFARIRVRGKLIIKTLKTAQRQFTKDLGFRGIGQADALPRLHLGSSLVESRGGDGERLVQRG